MNAELDSVLATARDAAVLLVDGRSGSGKTSLAAALETRLRSEDLPVWTLHIEDLYPGWDGLAAGSRAVATALADDEFRTWDWERDRYDAAVHPLPFARPLIIEGCGAITEANLAAARAWALRHRAASSSDPRIASVWIEVPDARRKARALARDGDTFAPHWERWAAQEAAHASEHDPRSLADQILA